MENLIQKNFMMQPDKNKMSSMTDENPSQISLRDQCERLYLELNQLKEENKKLMESKIKDKDIEGKSAVDLQSVVE